MILTGSAQACFLFSYLYIGQICDLTFSHKTGYQLVILLWAVAVCWFNTNQRIAIHKSWRGTVEIKLLQRSDARAIFEGNLIFNKLDISKWKLCLKVAYFSAIKCSLLINWTKQHLEWRGTHPDSCQPTIDCTVRKPHVLQVVSIFH